MCLLCVLFVVSSCLVSIRFSHCDGRIHKFERAQHRCIAFEIGRQNKIVCFVRSCSSVSVCARTFLVLLFIACLESVTDLNQHTHTPPPSSLSSSLLLLLAQLYTKLEHSYKSSSSSFPFRRHTKRVHILFLYTTERERESEKSYTTCDVRSSSVN